MPSTQVTASSAQLSSFMALEARSDLAAFGDKRIVLFALELGFGLDDIVTVAASALTDGPDDKKVDLLYVDRDSGRAIIAQGYMRGDGKGNAAPASKATELNTAISWALSGDLEDLPPYLKPAVEELRVALEEDVVTSIELWYCHNLPESANVDKELQQAVSTASSMLQANFRDSATERSISAVEVGRVTLQRWYESLQAPILVADTYRISVEGGFETFGDKWSSFTTSVPASWFHERFAEHGRRLFSANVRDYLGSRNSDRNINNNIKRTAADAPRRFWAYNNGITVLVNSYDVSNLSEGLEVSGLAIVNGAQTTGALGSVDGDKLVEAEVLTRFVKCTDESVIREIIQFNNSQNRVEAADFRSNDSVQTRLREEFSQIPFAEYKGGRRGGQEDKIRRPSALPDSTVAQALAVFHGEPNIAYNEKSRIWGNDATYSQFFHERTTAGHIVFCYTLLKTVERAKLAVTRKAEAQRTETEQKVAEYFRGRGSNFLLAAAIASCMEVFLDRAIHDRFALKFSSVSSLDECRGLWAPLVSAALPFIVHLQPALERNLRRRDVVTASLQTFRSLIEATATTNRPLYQSFAVRVSM